ncbi:hypothetical protein, partial [Vibrio echinoideorum]|uniref:hypothetical protein n=1 Tax=Vibrio echinoideorum TaxID=2100116 RepID=UPI0035508494
LRNKAGTRPRYFLQFEFFGNINEVSGTANVTSASDKVQVDINEDKVRYLKDSNGNDTTTISIQLPDGFEVPDNIIKSTEINLTIDEKSYETLFSSYERIISTERE